MGHRSCFEFELNVTDISVTVSWQHLKAATPGVVSAKAICSIKLNLAVSARETIGQSAQALT